MIIFKDIITGDEFFTDSSKYKVIDDCLYEVQCSSETRKEGQVVLAGSNPSAEETGEDLEDNVSSGLDVVLNHGLVETGFTKSDYKTYLKTYTKGLIQKLTEKGLNDEQITKAKNQLTAAVKHLLPKFDDCQFFMGSSTNIDGIVALIQYVPTPNGEKPFMYLFKSGIEEEKV